MLRRLAGAAIASVLALMSACARAETPGEIVVPYIALDRAGRAPASFLERPPEKEGLLGARLALMDNQTTGRLLKQNWRLDEHVSADEQSVVRAFVDLAAAGQKVYVVDVPPALLLKLSDLPEAKDAVILDATTSADSLRGTDCRRSMLHLLPSDAMLADALMQYLLTKQWRNLLLVSGPTDEDGRLAGALRRSARKFQLPIVQDKPWTFDPGARRTDTGHLAIGEEVARFTQGISYDVLVVIDTNDDFGSDIPYRTTLPRPVAGTHGLVPTAWAKPFEQWGGTQLQARFLKANGRWMTPRDYGAWLAVRAIGEAVTRAGNTAPDQIGAYLRGPKFELAGYKGVPLSFRSWDGQLRQPVLLADDRSLVSVSPQRGFLHQTSQLDTLGIDQPETTCRF